MPHWCRLSVSIRYTERLAEAGIEPSVGSVGDSYDNALTETINGLYKTEVIRRRAWRNRQDVELATLDWVHWYNHKHGSGCWLVRHIRHSQILIRNTFG